MVCSLRSVRAPIDVRVHSTYRTPVFDDRSCCWSDSEDINHRSSVRYFRTSPCKHLKISRVTFYVFHFRTGSQRRSECLRHMVKLPQLWRVRLLHSRLTAVSEWAFTYSSQKAITMIQTATDVSHIIAALGSYCLNMLGGHRQWTIKSNS